MGGPTDRFYADLPIAGGFDDVVDETLYRDVPPDWQVVITDVRGSTAAIERGNYKDVNLIGASCIIAALNAAGGLPFPFVFGGDGATLVVPPSRVPAISVALLATQVLAQQQFGLDLRVGIVPIAAILERDARVCVAKMRVSEHYEQAMFVGGGLACAEQLIKDPVNAGHFLLRAMGAPGADYSGLECRWQDVPSPHGEVHSLLVQATRPSVHENQAIYREVLQQIRAIYGSPEQYHPIAVEKLGLSFSPARLSGEARIRRIPVWKLIVANLLGFVLFTFGAKAFGVDWGRYKPDLRTNSDFRKFDEMVRMVLGGSRVQRDRLEAYLRARLAEGKLVYGIHHSTHALLTCLVFSREGNHLHFVDGGGGGYALAATQMKSQLAGRPGSRPS